MTRLLVLCEYASLNGGERSLLAVLPDVCRAGYAVQVAAPPRGPLPDVLRREGIAVREWDPRDGQAARPPLAETRRQLAVLLRQARPELVHANSLSMARLSGPVSQDLGLPCLGHLRDILGLSRAAVDDLNGCSMLLAVSRATRDWHVAQGMSTARTRVVYNGVDLQLFRPRRATGWLHRELQLPAGAPLIAAIGQIGIRKGLDTWLDAAARIAARQAQARFLLIGQRFSQKAEALQFERDLRARASAPPLAGRCHFLGTRGDIPALLPELTLLMHAARQEPLGRVLLEAAAAGVPVVATRAGGTGEIFGADSARLVPVDDDEALAARALELLLSPSLREQLALAARRRIMRRFTRRGAARRLLGAYRAVLSQARKRRD